MGFWKGLGMVAGGALALATAPVSGPLMAVAAVAAGVAVGSQVGDIAEMAVTSAEIDAWARSDS